MICDQTGGQDIYNEIIMKLNLNTKNSFLLPHRHDRDDPVCASETQKYYFRLLLQLYIAKTLKVYNDQCISII